MIAEYDTVYRDGETKRERAERVNRSSPELELSDAGLEYFNIFFKLCALRSGGVGGPEPIQPGTIRDWCEMTETELETWEKQLILDADVAYRRKMNEMNELHREADRQKSKGYQTNGHSDDRL